MITKTHTYTDGACRYRCCDLRNGVNFDFTANGRGLVTWASDWLYFTGAAFRDAPEFTLRHYHDGFNTSEVILSEGWR